MIQSHFLLILLISLGLTGCAKVVAAEPRSVDELLQQLQSDQRAERLEAERRLIEKGEEILDAIAPREAFDSALQFRLAKIRSRILQQAASQTLNGTRVTMKDRRVLPLGTVSQIISQQTGNDLRADPTVSQLEVNLLAEDEPFWKVVDKLSEAGDIGWGRTAGGVKFSPEFDIKHDQAAYPKCLRVAAFHRLQQQRFRGSTRKGLVRLSFRVDVEPLVTPYFLEVHDQNFQLRGDAGVSFFPFNVAASREIPFVGESQFEFTIDFRVDENSLAETRTVKEFELAGELELFCAARKTEIVVPLQAEADNQRLVQIVSTKREKAGMVITAEIEMPEGIEVFDSHRLALLHRGVVLRIGNEQIPVRQHRMTFAEGRRHTVEFTFATEVPVSEQVHFVYRYPQLFATLPVSFEIGGIQVSGKPLVFSNTDQ